MNKGIFITGTGFQTGKSFIGAGLAANLAKIGVNVGIIKPIVHECLKCSGKPYSIQGEMLKLAAGTMDEPDLVYPYCLRNRDFSQLLFTDDSEVFNLKDLLDKYRKLQTKYDYVIVVGVGGIAEKINTHLDIADIAENMGVPIVVVTNDNLDTFNDVQLCIKYSIYKNLQVKGFIINQKEEVINEKEERRINILKDQIEVPFLGYNPYSEGVNPVYGELGSLVDNFAKAIKVDNFI